MVLTLFWSQVLIKKHVTETFGTAAFPVESYLGRAMYAYENSFTSPHHYTFPALLVRSQSSHWVLRLSLEHL